MFSARELNGLENLNYFIETINEVFPFAEHNCLVPNSWDLAFSYLITISQMQRVIIIIDEYPYIAKKVESFSSYLQHKIDLELKDCNIMLVLSGSSMSFMEENVLGYDSPLFGRRTAQIKVLGINYLESSHYLPNYSLEDRLIIHSITGGVPHYLSFFTKYHNIDEVCDKYIFSSNGYLYEEPRNLLKDELRELGTYNVLLSYIAHGSNKLNDLATKTNQPSTKVMKYITVLIEIGIVEKIKPFNSLENKSIYEIKIGLFLFWNRFVPIVNTKITNRESNIYSKNIKNLIPEYMGRCFEEICKSYILKLSSLDKLPFDLNQVSRWWGSDPILKQEIEIDLLASGSGKAIFCECKWTNEPIGIGVLEKLRTKSEHFSYIDKYYYIFSKGGFLDKMVEYCKDDPKVKLITIDDLFNV
jgi:AAA+ ATPase superfamily predicted ATPase